MTNAWCLVQFLKENYHLLSFRVASKNTCKYLKSLNMLCLFQTLTYMEPDTTDMPQEKHISPEGQHSRRYKNPDVFY